jgi:hypothetical protein
VLPGFELTEVNAPTALVDKSLLTVRQAAPRPGGRRPRTARAARP